MKVTVILCSYNRCESLSKALDSVALSTLPASVQWEVLIVDNNSSDRTRSVAESYCSKYPRHFRYLFEAKQGKSYALNSAIRAADADVLAFVDDDVIVEPTWLSNLVAPLKSGEWSGSGGRILVDPGFRPPPWLQSCNKSILAPLAVFDKGHEARELFEAPFGTNMAFRREMFSKHGDFRTDLGPQPGSEIRDEDTEFGSRLLSRGERLWYEPSAVVFHAVPASRIRKTYFLRWWFDKARAEVRQYGTTDDSRWCIEGIPIRLFRRLLKWFVLSGVSIGESRRFHYKTKVWWLAGTICECHRRRKTPGKIST